MTLDTAISEDDALAAELTSALSNNAMTPADVATPNVEPVYVALEFKRGKGKCLMRVDARGFHAYLDRLGVQYDDYYCTYKDAPRGNGTTIASPQTNVLSPKVFLKRPADGETHLEYDLTTVYTTPPLAKTLDLLGESVDAVIDLIVDHYRPVEISVRVHAKGGK